MAENKPGKHPGQGSAPNDFFPPSAPSSVPADAIPATSPIGIPQIGISTAAIPLQRSARSCSHTLLVDEQPQHLRRNKDLLSLFFSVCGILLMLLLTVYGQKTTVAVTQDVQNALAVVLSRILLFPLQAIEGLITLIVPIVVLLERFLRSSWKNGIRATVGAVAGWLLGMGLYAVLTHWDSNLISTGLLVTNNGITRVGISTLFAFLAGLLTAAGERHAVAIVRYGWMAIWVVAGLMVLRSALSLPGALLSLLLGRSGGLVVRYLFGMEDNRAHGIELVRALRCAGVDAVRVVRMDRAPAVQAWNVTTDAPLGYTEQVRETLLTTSATNLDGHTDEASQHLPPAIPLMAGENSASNTISAATDVDLNAVLSQAHSTALEGHTQVHRLYAVWDSSGIRRNVTVLDADRQVVGFLTTVWDRIRVKGLSPNRDLSVRPAAEHAALMTLEAVRAGVRTPALCGLAEAGASILLVTEHVAGAKSFADLGANVSDKVLTQLWDQVRLAHAAGLAHHEIDADSVIVDENECVWLMDWDCGETISSELSRRVDLAQTLALVACTVGVKRAIFTASQTLSTPQLASIAPMLQRLVLPTTTREAMGRHRKLLQELRDALVKLTPTAHAEPARLARFSWRTVMMAVVGLVALWTLLAQLNIEQITQAVSSANIWWIICALVFSLATYVGAGLALVSFSPARLRLWQSTQVHLASAVVSLVAPAGVGGAAINLRFLQRKGVSTPLGIATVALVQVVQFLVTVVLLVIIAATTGTSTGLNLPSGWVLLGAAGLIVVISLALLIPKLRAWLWAKIEPTYRQVWPRLVWILSNPLRLTMGLLGTVMLSLSYILAFGASLWAFGYTLPFSTLAITYLAANTVGSLVPSPGGIGPVEIALTAGLVTAGIPSGVALSAAIVYRLVTFWIPIPVGWLSLQRLQKKGQL